MVFVKHTLLFQGATAHSQLVSIAQGVFPPLAPWEPPQHTAKRGLLERGRRRATKMLRGLWGDLIAAFQDLKGAYKQEGVNSLQG